MNMHKIKIISAAALFLLLIIIAFQNAEPVETKLLFLTLVMPRVVLLGATLLLGAISGMLLALAVFDKSGADKDDEDAD